MSKKKSSRPAFKRSLGLFDAAAISVGAIIGGGIFVVTGIAAGLDIFCSSLAVHIR